MNTISALERTIAIVGGRAVLARELKISHQAVSKWLRKQAVPPKQVLNLERLTEGRVTRYELRPDLYPRDDRRARTRE